MVKAIVGANWGDEGKGKITDMLAEESDIIVRFQGGANAGHTIINDYGKFALHLLPSGDFTKYVHTGENAYEGSEVLDEAVREYIKNVLCEGEWTYTKKSGEYTNDNPVYQLKKDGQKKGI